MPKKKSRRSNTEHPALKPSLNLKTRYEEIEDLSSYANRTDIDTLTLSDEDRDWLNKFAEEYVNDKLNRKNLKKNIHNTEKLKKTCDDRNNARNRDILTQVKAYGKLVDINSISEFELVSEDIEDLIIEKIERDRLEELKKSKKLKKRGKTKNKTNGSL